ncbi:hypothetical protein P7K49_014981 [Saguinus oedipus]|uniref:Uncharacterized protein n=1 Tax=Saguinus oedipus TaxID=9490 RepID=A0ABQ9V7X7_SAGOE|nr:hypothetical protein P7K49_014981 [Saguinus oedipus]
MVRAPYSPSGHHPPSSCTPTQQGSPRRSQQTKTQLAEESLETERRDSGEIGHGTEVKTDGASEKRRLGISADLQRQSHHRSRGKDLGMHCRDGGEGPGPLPNPQAVDDALMG